MPKISLIRNMAKTYENVMFYLKPYSVEQFEAYEEAVQTLNRLQSNASVISEAVRQNEKFPSRSSKLQLTEKYLKRCGIDIKEFERRIGVIHVSGTKGKGTTCALSESCLRAHGFRTGLFTSPHLVNVSERIRINGNPLTPDQFVRYFWSVYSILENNKDNESDMPSYFKFLTVMAFSVFIKEGVDVAILEVGIGGELDCTNVLKRTPVVGITSLDLDHTQILGNTIESIAWQKAGIMKPGSQVFTVVGHEASAFEVLKKRAAEKQASLKVVPSIEHYHLDTTSMSPVVKLNASLAIQLTHAYVNWKNGNNNEEQIVDEIPEPTRKGLESCWWPGRCQIISIGSHHFYLDGAHTAISASMSAQWFDSTAPRGKKRALLFNCTGSRDSKSILQYLLKCDIDLVVFTTNNMFTNGNPSAMVMVGTDHKELLNKCEQHRLVWEQLLKTEEVSFKDSETLIADSVNNGLELIRSKLCPNEECHTLITGSLHLVGSALAVLNEIMDKNNKH